jgi:hypothetical protein
VVPNPVPYIQGLHLSRLEKLLQKAIKSPQNLLFHEFCTLCSYFGMEKRGQSGSHVIYKRKVAPKFALSIQNDDGKAKPYQVREFLKKIKELGLYDFKEGE